MNNTSVAGRRLLSLPTALAGSNQKMMEEMMAETVRIGRAMQIREPLLICGARIASDAHGDIIARVIESAKNKMIL